MKRILVPTNFSDIANNAVYYALALAQALACEVIIFHPDQYNPYDLSRLKEEVYNHLSGAAGPRITYITSHKDFSSLAVDKIVKANTIDLIVMGTMGKGIAMIKSIFGRDTTEIAEYANCPVIAVPEGYTFSGIRIVAYASDLNFIEGEVGKVIELAKALSASLEIFHVSHISSGSEDAQKKDLAKRIEDIKQKYTYGHILYKESDQNANGPGHGISAFINKNNTDLLVIFHNHIPVFNEFIVSSNTSGVISHIKAPLLVYPKD